MDSTKNSAVGPLVKIDLPEHTVYWGRWLVIDPAAGPTAMVRADIDPLGDPWSEYQYYFNWWNRLKKWSWGYEAVYHDCRWYESFSFGFFNWSWTIHSTYRRCEKRDTPQSRLTKLASMLRRPFNRWRG
jgi:hypothetical protein